MWRLYHFENRLNVFAAAWIASLPLIAQLSDAAKETRRQLDPIKRLQLMSALALVIILGAFAILFVRVAGRLVQWYARSSESERFSKRPPIQVDDWAQKPITPPLDDSDAERPGE